MKLIDLKVSLDQLMLDPNNYRLDYDRNQKHCPDSKIVSLQKQTQNLLAKERLGELRDSILQNGFLEMDRIVVRGLNVNQNPPLYVVVEGNRRTAAFKGLIEDHHENIIELSRTLIDKSKSIGIICIEGTSEEIDDFAKSLMGIRHVSGPKKWTGYQSARLIDELCNDGKSLSEIGALLGCSAHDAGRRRRGYQAFMQMRNDRDYGAKSKANHYALLLEFLSPKKKGREWLGWNDGALRFENTKNLHRLYEAITSENDASAEIKNPGDARKFLDFLASDKHRKMIESGKHLSDLPPLNVSVNQLKEFLYLLSDIESRKITKEELGCLKKILSLANKILANNGVS